MAGLNDFQTGSDASLDDFKQDVDSVAPVNNPASNRNLAAHAVMFSDDPESIVKNYNAINAEMGAEGKSQLADSLFKQVKDHAFNKAKQSLMNVLADPSIPDDQKKRAAMAVYDGNSSLYSVQNVVSTEAAAAPMNREPVEVDHQRVNLGSVIDSINAEKRNAQILINMNSNEKNKRMDEHIAEMAQYLIPFADSYMAGKISSKLGGGGVKGWLEAFTLTGSSKEKLSEMIGKIKPEDRLAFTQKVIDVVNDSAGLPLMDVNDYAKTDYLKTVLEDGYYNDEKEWTDNILGVLNVAGLAGAPRVVKGLGKIAGEAAEGAKGLGKGKKAAAAWAKAEEEFVNSYSKYSKHSVRTDVQPASVAENVKDLNPEKARALHYIAASDESGEAAQALYGASKDEAVVHDLAPEIANEDGSVRAKVASPDAINNNMVTPDANVADFVNDNGAIYYTRAEKAATRSQVVHDFQHAFDLTDRKEMFQILSFDKADKSSGVKIKAVYGPQQGGYSDPLDAIELAKWALRKHGIDDANITLLKRKGSEYVPVDPAELKPKKDPGFYDGSDAQAAYNSGHYAETTTKGGKLRLVGVDHGGDVREVVAFDESGKQVGNVLYGTSDIRTDNPNVKVDPDAQRKGIANAMYDYAEKHGAKFPSADSQRNYRSEAGQNFRDARANRKERLEFTGPSSGGNGDYLIQVDHDYDFSPGDIASWDKLSVKNNPFDRIRPFTQGRAGSANRHFFDPASMFDPTLSFGAAVQTDKAAGLEKTLLELGDRFGKSFSESTPEMQQKMWRAITEANSKSIDFDYARLAADGFMPKEMDTLKHWRDYWDTHWYLENRDMAKTLRAKGYMQFIDPQVDTNLFARPLRRQNLKGSTKVYNSATGDVTYLKPDEIDALYKNGGTIAHLRQPVHIGEDVAEFIVSPEKAGGGYLRAIKDDSTVLAYRKGYYHVQYKDPHFIIKNVMNEKGDKVLYQKAVATAPTQKQAKLMVNRLKSTDGGDYFFRSDKNSSDYSRSDIDWDLHVTQGRSAQRVRGKRLEDATSTAIDPGMGHIADPVESMVNAARSISRRASLRDYLESGKARFIEQFGEVLPEGQFGQKVFPADRKLIGFQGNGPENKKLLRDARSTYEYLRYMEDGYINALDDGIKAAFNSIADIFGNAGFESGEKAAHWLSKHGGVTNFSKSVAFTLYLALNPLRQFVIQSHQAVQLLALNPKWAVSADAPWQTAYIIGRQLGIKSDAKAAQFMLGMTKDEAEEMFKHWEKSGLSAAIDKQNLVRGNLIDIADSFNKPSWKSLSTVKKALSIPSKVARGARKVGFDAGENFNMITAWLAHRDLAKKAGKDLNNPEVLDEITAQARNFTYNMNAAGDMPYNQNALGMMLQFMQVGHKAVLTMTLNRGLSKVQKARLIAFNALMYGLPTGAALALYNYLPDNDEVRETVSNGLEGMLFNRALSLATGEKTRIDFSGVAPINMYGTYEFIHSLFTMDPGTVLASTPSGQLFFGGNSRLTKFARTAGQYFNLVDNYGDPVEFSQVATDFAKLSSGMSNYFKARYAMKYAQKISSGGNVTDSNVSSAEAVAQLFGFQSLDESTKYYLQDYMYQKSKEHDDDVRQWYKSYKSDMTRDGITQDELAYVQKTYTEAFRVWGNDDYRAKQIIEKELVKDLENGDDRFYKQALNSINLLSPDEFKAAVNQIPDMSDEDKKRLLDLQDYIENVKDK